MVDRSFFHGAGSQRTLIGVVIVAGVLFVSIVVFLDDGDRERRAEDEPTETASTMHPTNRETGKDARKRSESSKKPLRVKKLAPGTYRFRLSATLPVQFPVSSRVSISLYRGGREIESGWQFRMRDDNQINWTTRMGKKNQRLPPGLYRVVAKITETGMDVPENFRRDVFPAEDRSFQNQVLSGHAWVYEIGVRVGTRNEIDRYEQKQVQWIKQQGSKMMDAWAAWRKVVQSLYKLHREGKTVPTSAANRLLKTLKQVRKQCETFRERPGQEESYLWSPNPPFEGDLRVLARTLPTKVNALTVTMLHQLIGGIPSDWPDEFRRSGFQSNIDVFHHMNQYHERTVADLRDRLSEWKGLDEKFQSARRYQRFRLRRLLAIPEAIHQLSEKGRILPFKKAGGMDDEFRRASLRVLVRQVRSLLTFHISAYRDTSKNMALETIALPDSTLGSVLDIVLLKRCRDLYRTLDVQIPESLSSGANAGSEDGVKQALKQFNMLKEQARSSDEQRNR